MKSIPILLAVLVCAIFASCSRENAAAPRANANQKWVILTEADIFGDEYCDQLRGIWQPSESEVLRAIHDVRPYLERLKKTPSADKGDASAEIIRGRIGEILSNWDKYLCQAVGHTKDGKKLIHLNFFRPDEDGFPTWWREHYVYADDGGALFWRIEYDCSTNTFSDVETNGDA
jgi:hypothetical protein